MLKNEAMQVLTAADVAVESAQDLVVEVEVKMRDIPGIDWDKMSVLADDTMLKLAELKAQIATEVGRIYLKVNTLEE
ncbi:MAG: hypothetical protein WC822_02465 [Candidatus Paceibacterota bacterium]|jgi:hypothetical protein